MKRIFITIIFLLILKTGFSQVTTSSLYHIQNAFGYPITMQNDVNISMEFSLSNNTNATVITPRAKGLVTNLDLLQLLEKGAILIEENISVNEIRHHLYRIDLFTSNNATTWNTQRNNTIDNSVESLTTNPRVGYAHMWNTLGYTLTYDKASMIPNVRNANYSTGELKARITHTYQTSLNGGATWAGPRGELTTTMRMYAGFFTIVGSPASTPDLASNYSSSDAPIRINGNVSEFGDYSGTGVNVGGGQIQFSPSIANIGSNVLKRRSQFYNGLLEVTQIINICNSAPTAPTITSNGETALCNGSTVTLTSTGSDITWSNGQTGNSITVNSAGTYYAYDKSACGNSANSNSIIVTHDTYPLTPTITASGSTNLCEGQTVTLTATGSNIVWSNGQTGNSITVSTAGTFYAYDMSACGNSANSNSITTTTTTTPAAPTITASGSTALCNGATVTLTATGSDVVWSNGQIGNFLAVSTAGTYYAYDRNSYGQSSASNSITITTNSTPTRPSLTASGATSLCNGATVTLTATGSNITWSNGQIGNSITVSTAGNYYAYDTNDCGQSDNSATIGVSTSSSPSAPTINTGGSTTEICEGGSLILIATGSNITWSNGQTGNFLSVNTAGTYYAYSSNSCGPSAPSNSITITNGSVPPAPLVIEGGSTVLCNGATITLTANGSNVTWSNGDRGNSITVSEAGSYYAYDTNDCGRSANSNIVTVTNVSRPAAPTLTANGSTVLCNGSSVTLQATGSNIIWSTGQTGNSIVVSSGGSYYAFDNNNCGASPFSNVINVTTQNSPLAPTVAAISSTDLCNGATVTLTATGSNITWSNGQTGNSITVSTAGNYYAYSTNSCGQSPNSASITVREVNNDVPPTITASGSTELCNGATVTLTASGTGTATGVRWNTGAITNSITVSEAGTYYAYYSNSCGQSGNSNTIVVTKAIVGTAPTVTSSSQYLCDASGVTLTATGNNIVWSNGATGNTITVFATGTYYAFESVECGNSANSNEIVISGRPPQATPPVISSNGGTILCNGQSITLTATGTGVIWNNGETGNSITVSEAGFYFAYIPNACGQFAPSNFINITSGSLPSAPTITANSTTTLCNGATVTLTATGSNITWSNGQTGNSITVSEAGNYYAYSTNTCGNSANSNTLLITTNITPAAPTITTSSTTLCNGATVTLTATGSNITWSNGETGNSITVSAAGTYYAFSYSLCGSSPHSNSITINNQSAPAAPTITASGTTSLCNGATVTLTATGTNITWSNGQTGNTIMVSTAGTYYAYATNDCGQSINSNSIAITTDNTPSAPSITASGITDLCNGATVTLTATGSNITWSNGLTGNSITVSTAGTYYAYSTNGCGQSTNSNVITVRAGTVNTPTISTSATMIFANEDVTLTSSIAGPIEWFRDGNSVFIGGKTLLTNTAGTYKAREINSIGCASNFSNEIIITKYSDETEIPVIKPPITPGVEIIDNGDGTSTMKFCTGLSFPLTAPLADTYKWFKNGVEIVGQTARIFQVSEAGNYTVQIVKNGNSYTTPILKVELYSLPNRPVINY